MANEDLHEPGPSFVPDDVPTERLAQMPAWLQTFAAQEMPDYEDVEPEVELPLDTFDQEPEPFNAAVELPSDDIILPDWLQDDGPAVDVVAPVMDDDEDILLDDVAATPFLNGIGEPVSTDPDTFISEDDLPDWLRAFSEESAPESAQVAVPDVAAATVTEAVNVRVPPVESVWLSDTERRALGPGGTLFALLAANKDVDDSDDVYAMDSEPTGHAATPAARDADAPGGSPDQDEAAKRKSRQLLLLTLAIVVLVIMVSYMAFR